MRARLSAAGLVALRQKYLGRLNLLSALLIFHLGRPGSAGPYPGAKVKQLFGILLEPDLGFCDDKLLPTASSTYLSPLFRIVTFIVLL